MDRAATPGSGVTEAVQGESTEANLAEVVSVRFRLLDFVRSAGVLSASAVASVIRAVLTAKVLAVALGPFSVGILSQILNFSALVFTIIPLGLTTGVAKMVAEASDDAMAVNRVVGTSVAISTTSGLAAALLLAPLASEISTALTGSARYSLAVLLTLASFPLYNLAGVLSYVLQGLSDVKRLTWANVATAIAALVTVVPLTIALGLVGAVLAVLIGSVTQVSIFALALWRAYRQRRWQLGAIRFSSTTARSLLGYGWILLVASLAMWGSLLAGRTLTVRQLGGYQNGLYQVAYGLSNQYMTVFMTWMAAYVFPRVAAERDHTRLSELLNSALRANLFLMVPVLVLTIGLRAPLIRVFYTSAFLAATPLIAIQVVGDFLRVVGWSFGVSLFAQGRTLAYLGIVLAQSIAWVVITAAALPRLGIQALAVGYAVSYVAWPLAMYPMVRRWFGVKVERENLALLVLGIACLGAALTLPAPSTLVLAAIIPAVIYMRHRGLLTVLAPSSDRPR